MIEILIGVFSVMLFIILLFILLITTQKRRHHLKLRRTQKTREYLFKKYLDNESIKRPVSNKFLMDALIEVDEQIHLDEPVRAAIIEDIRFSRFIKRQYSHLHALRPYKRRMAVYYLSKLRTEEVYQLLFERFKKEKNESIRLRIVEHLRYGFKEDYLYTVIDSLIGSSDAYHERLCTVIGNNYKRLYQPLMRYQEDNHYPIVLALVRIASFHADAFLMDYMVKRLSWVIEKKPFSDPKNLYLKESILKNLLTTTPELLQEAKYLHHEDVMVQSYAIKALSASPSKATIQILLKGLDQSVLDQERIKTLSKIVLDDRSLLDHLLRLYDDLTPHQQFSLTEVFADRIDYIILNIHETKPYLLKAIIKNMINESIVEPLIDFLNHNQDNQVNQSIIKTILAYTNEETIKPFKKYLNERVLNQMELKALEEETVIKEKVPIEKTKVLWMIRWMLISLLVFPLIFIIRMWDLIPTLSFQAMVEAFIIDVNIYLIFYFVTINMIYIILFILAIIASKKQVMLAKTRKYSLLFSEKLLPGISIIAPAYNESVSIVESVSSLLNLKYPNYEVVVVNDGSKDETLKILIDYFKLERKHPTHKNSVNTKTIRGIYKTKTIPNLVVVDKVNGGKADALNVGINVSQHDYVCGIDADSILDTDALLKLSSAMLDDTMPYVAMGGNIYPANGFTFDKGKVEEKHIPKETVCRLQTIEYLRAFTSGRIGWSELRSLMIISGAFGLFKKDALIETGGYLTSSSKLKKDTVGEDMELVVRLTKQAIENKDPHRVAYVYNAYCYTELPSDLNTLLKQRNRWQRGLIDILSYHRNIGFNPKYKQIGLIGYPYFFIFEFLGPFFEAQGYLMLLIALILGLLNPVIILAIFISSIMFGVIISLSSLYMSEREMIMMNHKETLILILFAIFENFGYRQLISMHRVSSSFKALKESGAWGVQKRKGFNA